MVRCGPFEKETGAAAPVFVQQYSYLAAASMYSTAARMSASVAAARPPFGGIAPLPLMTEATRASTPVLLRAAQATLSPYFGAPATPVAWQALHAIE